MGGLNQVPLGPLTHRVFDGAASRTWVSEGAQCGAALGQLNCHGVSGTRDLPLSSKKMYAALGGAGGKVTRRDQRESGESSKQTDTGKTRRITFSDTVWLQEAADYRTQ